MQSHNNSSADTSRAFAIEIKVVKLSLVQPVSICEMCVVPTSAFSAKASWVRFWDRRFSRIRLLLTSQIFPT